MLKCQVHLHAAVEVHAVDTNRRVVLDSQIDMLRDPESEIACVAEVLFSEFVLFDFQTTLEDLFGFGTADCDMYGNLLVTSDTEGSDSVSSFACGGLAGVFL